MPRPSPEPFSGDYESIAAAVQETPRGRWFLAEYARRNRQADTQMLLDAIRRLESAMFSQGQVPAGSNVGTGLAGIADRIANIRKEIATAELGGGLHQRNEGADALDCVTLAAESATSDILASAERVQETAWTLREQGVAPAICDFLDAQATDIYAACSLQDFSSQQTRRIIDLLRHLEGRISAMTEIWGANPASSEAIETVADAPPLSQHDDHPAPAAPALTADAPPVAPSDSAATADDPNANAADADTPRGEAPFSALRTLSTEETIALFT
ncbi:MAG: hypothetical protein J0H17_02810 [Rhizobiales bacterium]|nr:hypothetical protein [Hyphomicrobiales bacterium]